MVLCENGSCIVEEKSVVAKAVQVEERELRRFVDSETQTVEVMTLAQVRPINHTVSHIFTMIIITIIIVIKKRVCSHV